MTSSFNLEIRTLQNNKQECWFPLKSIFIYKLVWNIPKFSPPTSVHCLYHAVTIIYLKPVKRWYPIDS